MLGTTGCSSMMGYLNPLDKKPAIDVTAQVGKTNVAEKRTQLVEAKVVSNSATSNANEANTINQAYTNVEPWMVLLIALGFGFALPSPMAWYSNRRERVFLKEQIRTLQKLLQGVNDERTELKPRSDKQESK